MIGEVRSDDDVDVVGVEAQKIVVERMCDGFEIAAGIDNANLLSGGFEIADGVCDFFLLNDQYFGVRGVMFEVGTRRMFRGCFQDGINAGHVFDVVGSDGAEAEDVGSVIANHDDGRFDAFIGGAAFDAGDGVAEVRRDVVVVRGAGFARGIGARGSDGEAAGSYKLLCERVIGHADRDRVKASNSL